MPTDAVFALIHNSRDLKDDPGYWACISVLQARGDQETYDTCAEWAKDASRDKRQAAADILRQLGYEFNNPFSAASWPVLQLLLQDGEADVVAAALNACGTLGVGSPSVLATFALHANSIIRLAAVHALSRRDDLKSIDGLVRLSQDLDPDIRNWATFGLGQQTDIDTPAIRSSLFERLGDDDPKLGPEIRGEALIGLAIRLDTRVLAPLRRELAGEFHGSWCIEAARVIADPSLHDLLVALKDRLEEDDLKRIR